MTQEPSEYQRKLDAVAARDAQFKGKKRSCPKCETVFVSQFDWGQCTGCGYKFPASNPTGPAEFQKRADDEVAAALEEGRRNLIVAGEISWRTMEDVLFDLCSRDISSFADLHADETFYGFAFDCNSEYGNILLCLNTSDRLIRRAEAYKTNHEDLYRDKSLDQICADLRWNMGDWEYQGFNSESFDSNWRPYEAVILDICMDEEEEDDFTTPICDLFMKSVCRALVRLEQTNAFDCLSRTEDFTTFAADHDELDSTSWDRLAMARSDAGT